MDAVYSEAKFEYTRQLTVYLQTPFHRFFLTLLQQAGQEEPNAKKVLSKFQDLLSQVPEWNVDKVERETSKIATESHCDYLEELLTAVFIAHTKILTAIRLGSKHKKVQITIPKLPHFLHRALTETSRLLWTNVYLFQGDLPSIEKQKNHRQIEGLINDGIEQAIRSLLPVKNILKDYLSEGADEAEEEEEEEEETKAAPEDENVKSEVKEEPKAEPEPAPKSDPEPEPKAEPEPESKPEEPKPTIVLPEVPSSTSTMPIIEKLDLETVPSQIPATCTQEQQTLFLQSTPTVQFADQVHIMDGQHEMQFQEFQGNDETDDTLKILDDDGADLSDFEDLDAAKPENLGASDFESL